MGGFPMNRTLYKLVLVFVTGLLTFGIFAQQQEPQPYVSRFVHWKLPTNNTDGSRIIDFSGVNLYYSLSGESDFVRGTNSANFLMHVESGISTPSDIGPNSVIQTKAIKWDGIFDNTNLWIRTTSVDRFGNESGFSVAAIAAVNNVNLTNTPYIINVALEDGGMVIWITESDATEDLQISTNPSQDEWVDAGPLLPWYDLEELNPNNEQQYYRVVRNEEVTNLPPIAIATSDVVTGYIPMKVRFDGSKSSDPEGQPLYYDWDLGNNSGADSVIYNHIYPQPGIYLSQLSVFDGTHRVNAEPITITALNWDQPHPNLVAQYLFDEIDGQAVLDTSSNNNNGVISNVTRTNSSINGKALYFNGGSSYVTVPNHPTLNPTNAVTIMAWVYPVLSDQKMRTILMKTKPPHGLTYGLYAYSTDRGTQGFYINGQVLGGRRPLSANRWAHVSATFDGSTMHLYINGYLSNRISTSEKLISSTGELMIGGNNIWIDEGFHGIIDEVKIFNSALSTAEIRVLMDSDS